MPLDCCSAAKAIFCSIVGLWLTSCGGDAGPKSTADGWVVSMGEEGQDWPLSMSMSSLSDEILGDCVPAM